MTGYARTLRLRHLDLASWQGEALSWGVLVLAVLLALTGLVSPWGILLLPLVVAAVVKGHDVLAGRLAASTTPHPRRKGPDISEHLESNEPPAARGGGPA